MFKIPVTSYISILLSFNSVKKNKFGLQKQQQQRHVHAHTEDRKKSKSLGSQMTWQAP